MSSKTVLSTRRETAWRMLSCLWFRTADLNFFPFFPKPGGRNMDSKSGEQTTFSKRTLSTSYEQSLESNKPDTAHHLTLAPMVQQGATTEPRSRWVIFHLRFSNGSRTLVKKLRRKEEFDWKFFRHKAFMTVSFEGPKICLGVSRIQQRKVVEFLCFVSKRLLQFHSFFNFLRMKCQKF